MRWVDVDTNNRISELPILMGNVRLPLVSKEYLLHHVEPNVLIESNFHCRYILIFLEIL